MFINQISVFLENKSGQLSEFIKLLADNNVDIQALSIAETQDYGILRIIVDRPEDTAKLLKDNNFTCKLTPVLGVTVPDTPGSLTNILSVLAENNISLEYAYAFFSREKGSACIVIRVEDNDAALAVLKKASIIE